MLFSFFFYHLLFFTEGRHTLFKPYALAGDLPPRHHSPTQTLESRRAESDNNRETGSPTDHNSPVSSPGLEKGAPVSSNDGTSRPGSTSSVEGGKSSPPTSSIFPPYPTFRTWPVGESIYDTPSPPFSSGNTIFFFFFLSFSFKAYFIFFYQILA